ncbi:hypothetical protein [Neobacillus mesonae]|uniref:hypothetical protein n=1 Tax=Neobacillus mesonae TaxID=1193713 RepID=UPI002E1E1E23|nr:hypothetical protein [Neobacillus mesonae]
MYSVSDGYKTAISSDTRIIDGYVIIGLKTYYNDTIESMSFEDTVNPEDVFAVGTVSSAYLELTLLNVTGNFDGAQVKPYIGVDITGAGNFEYVPLGIFNVEETKKNKGSITLKCFDNMIKTEKPFSTSLTYPASITAIMNEICSKTGITFSGTLPNYSVPKPEAATTFREVIGLIAGVCGGFAKFNRSGVLNIKSYAFSIARTIDSDNYFDLNKEDGAYSIGKVTMVDESNETSYSKGTVTNTTMELIINSPWATDAITNDIYTKLNGLSFIPVEMPWQGDPALDVGDWVTISEYNATPFNTIMTEVKLSFAGGLSADFSSKCEGKTKNQYNTSPKVLGIKGLPGKDGKTYFTWIKYADSPTSGMSDLPDGKKYIGLAYNKLTPEESTVYSDYSWSLIQGAAGAPGADGKTYYTWIKYADTPTAGMSDDPTGKKYMGIAYNKTTSNESTNYADYEWSLVKGDKGDNGADAIVGVLSNEAVTVPADAAGTVQSLTGAVTTMSVFNGTVDDSSKWTVALAGTPSGLAGSLTGKTYSVSGVTADTGYVDLKASRTGYADIVKRFTVTKAKQGNKGTDGQTTYTWVKYADDANGNGMSDSPNDKRFMGIATNKTTANKSTNPADYTWSPLYDNVKVGGRNLLKNSNVVKSGTGYPLATYAITEPLAEGETVTISFKGNLGRSSWGIYNSGGYVNLINIYPSDMGADGVYKKTFTWKIKYPSDPSRDASNTTLNVYPMPNGTGTSSTIEWIQLERGNVASDRTPAPEDTQAAIENAQTSADGKNRVFRQGTQPTGSFIAGDMWFNTSLGNQLKVFDGKAWVLAKFDYNALTVEKLSALAADLGDVTAGNITGVNINGSKIASTKDSSNYLKIENQFLEAMGTMPDPDYPHYTVYHVTNMTNGVLKGVYGDVGIGGILTETGKWEISKKGIKVIEGINQISLSPGKIEFIGNSSGVSDVTISFDTVRGFQINFKPIWTKLTLLNGAVLYGTSDVVYTKIGNVVYIHGAIKGLTGASTQVGALPVGFRPSQSEAFAIPTSNNNGANFARWLISTTGAITMESISSGGSTATTAWYPMTMSFVAG